MTADFGSISKAARQHTLVPAMAAAGLKRLKLQLNTHSFVRSTRSLRVTPKGPLFLNYSRQPLALLTQGRR
ncbi:MAG: LysR family transcriptional regulator [Glaciimonas sp.]|nr:LysR family transcriptional regulator [Glaciimonas sp.]